MHAQLHNLKMTVPSSTEIILNNQGIRAVLLGPGVAAKLYSDSQRFKQ